MSEPVATYYDVLQVERGATPEHVRAAWRRLARQYHPDRVPGNAQAARAMAAINVAYDVLSDPQRRAEHDLWIRRAERVAAPLPASPPPTSLWAFVHPATHWAWYLLGGTLLFVLGTVATALYLTSMPARTAVAAADACAPGRLAEDARCARR